MKIIEAWAFLAEGKKDKYFIVENIDKDSEVYFKKPKARMHPFNDKLKWKPTKIYIFIE